MTFSMVTADSTGGVRTIMSWHCDNDVSWLDIFAKKTKDRCALIPLAQDDQ